MVSNFHRGESKPLAIATIVVVALINIRGVSLGAGFVRPSHVAQTGVTCVCVSLGFGFQLGDWSNFTPFVARRADPLRFLSRCRADSSALFFVCRLVGPRKTRRQVKNAGRTLPRALIYGVIIITIVYILTSFAFVYLVPLERVRR